MDKKHLRKCIKLALDTTTVITAAQPMHVHFAPTQRDHIPDHIPIVFSSEKCYIITTTTSFFVSRQIGVRFPKPTLLNIDVARYF